MYIKLILLSLTILFSSQTAYSKQCEDCPAGKPCNIIVPKGDKCNTCKIKVHCSDEFWYQQERECTYLDCTLFTPIENPFEMEKEESL